MNMSERVRASFDEQAGHCRRLGSEFMAILMAGLAEKLDKSTMTGRRVLEWGGDPEPKSDALALRLAGGLHALGRNGADPVLFEYYANPDKAGEEGFLSAVMAAIEKHDEELLPWLDLAPQTNEVARASAIYAGLSVISEQFGLPLALHEMGCSGGLNLQCNRFGYRFSGNTFGDETSPLQLSPEWTGNLPPDAAVNVISRLGCDLNPISVSDPNEAAKLIAYLWPDQAQRIERVAAAIEIARADPPQLEPMDAADWVEQRFNPNAGHGVIRVLYNTIAWNYFPQAIKDRIVQHMIEVGSTTSENNPIAWLQLEFDEESDEGPFLTLRTWPGGGETEVLARMDAHVYRIEWFK